MTSSWTLPVTVGQAVAGGEGRRRRTSTAIAVTFKVPAGSSSSGAEVQAFRALGVRRIRNEHGRFGRPCGNHAFPRKPGLAAKHAAKEFDEGMPATIADALAIRSADRHGTLIADFPSLPSARRTADHSGCMKCAAMALVAGRADLDGAADVGFDIELPVFTGRRRPASWPTCTRRRCASTTASAWFVPQRTDGGARRYCAARHLPASTQSAAPEPG